MADPEIKPDFDIPDLKRVKEDREKKRGAAAPAGGTPAGGAQIGGGGAAGTSRAAQALGNLGKGGVFGGGSPVTASRGLFSSLFRGNFGVAGNILKTRLAAAGAGMSSVKAANITLALALGGAGIVGYAVFGRAVQQQIPDAKVGALGELASTIIPRRRSHDGSRSLKFLSDAAAGVLKWVDPDEGGDAGADAVQDPGAVAEGAMNQAGEAVEAAVKGAESERLGNFGSKLGDELGKSSKFGDANVFQGGDTGFNLKQVSALNSGAGAGRSLGDAGRGHRALAGARGQRMTAMRRGGHLRGSGGLAQMTTFGRALSQLKFARKTSVAGAQSGVAETGSQSASDAFSGQSTQGSGGGGIPGGGAALGGDGIVDPMGGGAQTGGGSGNYQPGEIDCPSGWTKTADGACDPGDIGGENISPDQMMVDMAQGMVWAAMALIMIGSIIVQICQGKAWLELLAMVGRAMVIIGIILGVVILAMGAMMKDPGYMAEYIALGVAMIAGGAAGLYGGARGIGIMVIIMALAAGYLLTAGQKIEDTDHVDSEDYMTSE